MSIYTAYANSIVLQIDEANRALTYNGGTTPIILGVRGDDCAERIYFESPKQLSPEIDLLESSDTVKVHVYVNYRNAVNEPYIQECTDVSESATSDTVNFSWIVTNKATINRGEVKFNVCVKRTVYNAETDKWELTNEWHTTTFVGKVLDGIDVTKKTPEVITHDSVTIEQLTVQTNAYAAAVNGYATEVNELHKTLDDVNAYVDESVNNVVISEVARGYVTNEEYNNFTLETSAKFDNYLLLAGGKMSGNIEFTSGGIMFNNPDVPAVGGWTFSLTGYPTIVSDELKICASTETDPFAVPLEYKLPAENGTLARIEDIPEAPKYYEHRITIFTNNDDTFAYARFVSKSNHPISSIAELAGVILSYVKATNIQTAIMATGLSKSSLESEWGPVCSLYAYSETELRLAYIDSSYDMQLRDVTETDWLTSDEVVEIN